MYCSNVAATQEAQYYFCTTYIEECNTLTNNITVGSGNTTLSTNAINGFSGICWWGLSALATEWELDRADIVIEVEFNANNWVYVLFAILFTSLGWGRVFIVHCHQHNNIEFIHHI